MTASDRRGRRSTDKLLEDLKIASLPREEDISRPGPRSVKMGTALMYDEEMTKYKLLWIDPDCMIESPERLTVSHDALIQSGLADRCVSVPVREATDADILLVHSEEYLEAVKTTPNMTLEELQEFTLQFGDVYFHPNIYHCAKLAAGAALQLVDGVLTGKVRNGMALVRPPGHHSMRGAANGFCVFNNVAIAARYAQQKHAVKRILIVDWDIHHGQGVQYCFEDDPSVLYFSWHRYQHQNFWPNLRESDYDCVGKERGAGFNINVPWNQLGMENSDYLSVFYHVLLPVAYEFCPDLVLVCAGFDSAIGDPEGKMNASPEIYAHLTHLLMNLAGGKLCAVLEGGYNLTSLSQSVCQTVQTLLGDPAPAPGLLDGPCQSTLESIHCVRAAHRRYWSCLKHAADLPTAEIRTKIIKSAAEEERVEEKAWPEPEKRLLPPIRTVVVLPDGVPCPVGCRPFRSSEDLDPGVFCKLRKDFLAYGDEARRTFSRLMVLTEKMEKNQVSSGLALVPDVSMAMMFVVQHAAAALSRRVLVVCVGDGPVLTPPTDDGRTLLVRLCCQESEEQRCRFYVPVCLKKGCRDLPGFMQAVLGLLLPLAYQYDPELVLLVRMPGSGLSDGVWQQLTALLQGLAQGHMLVLLQEAEVAAVSPTASSLLGEAAPPLDQLGAPLAENVQVLERLRLGLQNEWTLLKTTAAGTRGGDEH